MAGKQAFDNNVEIQWCPGCPNFSILQAFKKAFAELDKNPDDICLVSGIGQAAKLPHYLNCNFFNGLHGRALPVATAINAVNPDLTTVVVTGEGDCYGEGGNHFLHSLRRNPDITLVVHNNEIYALTKGQASPTTQKGEKRTLQFRGMQLNPLNMPAVAIVNGCTFVARGFAGDIEHLKELIIKGIRHKGFSYIDVIQPCITWGIHPVKWYKERVYKLSEDFDPGDREAALAKTAEWGEKMPIGIFYQTDPSGSFTDDFQNNISDVPLFEPAKVDKAQYRKILDEYIL